MSVATYNAGVAARATVNAKAKTAGNAIKKGVLAIVDFGKGFVTAEEKPSRRRVAAKPAAKRTTRRK